MSFDFSALITTRTESASYFASDINRVSECMDYLVEELAKKGVTVSGYQRVPIPSGQPNAGGYLWTDKNWGTPSFVAAQLRNVQRVRDALAVAEYAPNVPEHLIRHEEANDIERILQAVETSLRSMEKITLHAAQPLLFCGFSLYPVTQIAVVEPEEPDVPVNGLRLYTADGLTVTTADGLSVYLES